MDCVVTKMSSNKDVFTHRVGISHILYECEKPFVRIQVGVREATPSFLNFLQKKLFRVFPVQDDAYEGVFRVYLSAFGRKFLNVPLGEMLSVELTRPLPDEQKAADMVVFSVSHLRSNASANLRFQMDFLRISLESIPVQTKQQFVLDTGDSRYVFQVSQLDGSSDAAHALFVTPDTKILVFLPLQNTSAWVHSVEAIIFRPDAMSRHFSLAGFQDHFTHFSKDILPSILAEDIHGVVVSGPCGSGRSSLSSAIVQALRVHLPEWSVEMIHPSSSHAECRQPKSVFFFILDENLMSSDGLQRDIPPSYARMDIQLPNFQARLDIIMLYAETEFVKNRREGIARRTKWFTPKELKSLVEQLDEQNRENNSLPVSRALLMYGPPEHGRKALRRAKIAAMKTFALAWLFEWKGPKDILRIVRSLVFDDDDYFGWLYANIPLNF